MSTLRKTAASAVITLLALIAVTAHAQQPRFLSLTPPEGLPVIPVLEGWVANPDGSRSFSFGIINRNEHAIDLPIGDANFVEPARYNGMQPTHFPPGRSTGVFYVTTTPADAGIDVWWNLKTGDSEVLKVPGRAGVGAYELDFDRPRPQGALQPWASFGDDLSPGLLANITDHDETVSVGEPTTLTISASDPAERDPTDPRFGEPLDMGVTFVKYQGPGDVTFERTADAPEPENPFSEGDPRFARWSPPEANETEIPGPSGTASVNAIFSAPGEYLILGKVDIHSAPDSSNGDQCCWTNVLTRVTVTQ